MKVIGQWIAIIFLVMIIAANVSNSVKQVVTLIKVSKIVDEQKMVVKNLKKEEEALKVRVEYAQSEEYKDRSWRKLLGLGTENDYWIIMPKSHNFESVYPTPTLEANIPHWREWLNLIVPSK